jgi:hypothetical protein
MKKEAVLCLCTALMLVSLASVGSVASTANPNVDISSVASQFLVQVAGFNTSNYQVILSTPSEPSVMSSTHVTPHFETHVLATISDEHGQSDAVLSFIDGKFWSYDSHSLYGNLRADEQSFNDSLNALVRIVNGYQGLFNASYCSDFAQLVSTALQTQELSVENQEFSLQIQNGSTLLAVLYAKIDGQYTSLRRSMQVCISSAGLVTNILDNLNTYYVATTNVTVSKDQAIAIAEPYIEAFAQKNQQNVTVINATLGYEDDGNEERGDSLALYPVWHVLGTYDTPGLSNATSYSVWIWADNGRISGSGPLYSDLLHVYGPPSNTNAQAGWPLLLILPAVIIFALASGMYLQHKPKARRR